MTPTHIHLIKSLITSPAIISPATLGTNGTEPIILSELVIGFEFGHRAMTTIFTDGCFLWNQNTGNTYGCSRLEFTGKTYKTIELWRVENNESGFTTYYINGKTATKAEFESLNNENEHQHIKWNSLPITS